MGEWSWGLVRTPWPAVLAGRGWLPAVAGMVLVVGGVSASPTWAATFTVTTAADSGAGSLRQAILDSNAATGQTNTIDFAIGSGPAMIDPDTGLPAVTTPVVIDGTSQPGFSGQPLIDLYGGKSYPSDGLDITAGYSTVRGLDVYGFLR